MIQFTAAVWADLLAQSTAAGRAQALATLNPRTIEFVDADDVVIRTITTGNWSIASNPLGGWNAIPGEYVDDGTGEGVPSYAVWKASGTEVMRMSCSIALEADYKLLKDIEEGVPIRRANFAVRFQTPTQQGTAPAFTTAPTITGTPAVGQTLTAASGTVTGEPIPALSYQWIANENEVLTGQAGSTLTLTSAHLGKTIKVRQTASNSNGTAESTSTATAAVTGAIPDPLSASFPASISVAQGREYSLARHVSGGTAPISYAATGLPANVTLNALTGMLTVGATATIATTSITVTVTDAASGNEGGAISLSITAAPTITELDALVTLTNRAGSTATNTPVHRVIPFRQGQIPSGQYPVAQIGGVDIAAQQFVIKARHADNSVKHGIFSAIVPSLAASGTADIEWIASNTDPNGSPISKAAVVTALGSTSVTITDSTDPLITRTWDIASILNAATIGSDMRQSFEWVNGAQCVCYVLRDRVGTTYDLTGPDGQIVTPMFEVWHWPSLSATLVCFRFEISKVNGWGWWPSYDISISNAAGSPVFTESAYRHTAGSAWRKRIWVQGSDPMPGTFDVKMDNEWLSSIGAMFRYDPSHTVPLEGGGYGYKAINQVVSSWASANQALRGKGLFTYHGMGSASVQSELGPYPGWDVVAHLSGRADVQKICIENADLGLKYAGMITETNSATESALGSGSLITKRYWLDFAQTVEGKGWPVTTYGRPGLRVLEQDLKAVEGGEIDGWVSIGTGTYGNSTIPVADQDWSAIKASHLYNIFTVPFMFTGEFHYLDIMFHWIASTTLWASYGYHRDAQVQYRRPTLSPSNGVRGLFRPQLMIWDCAWWSPDDSQIKTTVEDIGIDCLLTIEGGLDVQRDDNTTLRQWQWRRAQYGDLCSPNFTAYVPTVNRPAQNWKVLKPTGDAYTPGSFADHAIDTTKTVAGDGFWIQAYAGYGFMNGVMKGYPTGAMADYIAERYFRHCLDDGALPRSIAMYLVPVIDAVKQDFFTSIADAMATMDAASVNTKWDSRADYREMSLGAIGALAERSPNGYDGYAARAAYWAEFTSGYEPTWDIAWRIWPRGN